LLEIPNQQKKLGENHRSSPSSCALTIEQLTVSPL
jgi:hypothetical protein